MNYIHTTYKYENYFENGTLLLLGSCQMPVRKNEFQEQVKLRPALVTFDLVTSITLYSINTHFDASTTNSF